MLNTLMYPCFNSEGLVRSIIGDSITGCGNPVFSWMLGIKLPENPTVTPTSSVQVITASAKNRFLESVTVEAVTTPTP